MRRRPPAWAAGLLALLLLAVGLAAPVTADIVHLVNGNRLTGEIVDESEDVVWIRTKIGVQEVHRDDIDRIERILDPKAEFEKRAGKLERRGLAEAWFELGRWAEERELWEEAERAYEAAIHRDPEHARARAKLGYKRVAGEWLSEAERMRRLGYVEHDGRWVRPEDKDKLEQGYVMVNGRWVHRTTLEREAEEAREAERRPRERRPDPEPARPAEQEQAKTPPQPRPRIVKVPPPEVGKPPTDEQLAAWLEDQKQRAREAERVLGLTFEDVEEGPLLVHTTQPKDSERFRTFLRELGKLYKAETKIYNIPFEAKIWPGKLQIYFFKDKSQFDAFATRVDNAGGAVASGGYFIEGEGTNYSKFHIAMYNLKTGTLAHELSHAFTARYNYSRKHVIPWANEGIAEFLRLYVAENMGLGAVDNRHWSVAKEMLNRGDPRMSLDHMFRKTEIAGTEGWAYAVGWSIVHFMVEADKRAFVRFLKIMKRTDGTFSDRWRPQSPEEQRAAIEEAYGVPLETFEAKWKEFVRDAR